MPPPPTTSRHLDRNRQQAAIAPSSSSSSDPFTEANTALRTTTGNNPPTTTSTSRGIGQVITRTSTGSSSSSSIPTARGVFSSHRTNRPPEPARNRHSHSESPPSEAAGLEEEEGLGEVSDEWEAEAEGELADVGDEGVVAGYSAREMAEGHSRDEDENEDVDRAHVRQTARPTAAEQQYTARSFERAHHTALLSHAQQQAGSMGSDGTRERVRRPQIGGSGSGSAAAGKASSSERTTTARSTSRKDRGGPAAAAGGGGPGKAQHEEEGDSMAIGGGAVAIGAPAASEIVNRRSDGSYLLDIGDNSWMLGATSARRGDKILINPHDPKAGVETEEEREEAEMNELDRHYAAIARQFFASGAAGGGANATSKKHEEEVETLRIPMMLRLREQVMQRLEEDRWRYEPVDRVAGGF